MRISGALVALLGVVAALGLVEVAARLHGDRVCVEDPGAFYTVDPVTGWNHLRGLHGWVGTCTGALVPAVPMDTSAHGLLDPDPADPKPAATRRILILGGNLPEGLGVRREANVARVMEGMADRRRGAPLDVVNAAVGGWALDNDLVYLRAEGRRYAPDVVVVFVSAAWDLTAIWPPLMHVLGARPAVKPYFHLDGDRLVGPEWPVPLHPDATPARTDTGLAASALYRLLTGTPALRGDSFDTFGREAMPPGTLDVERTEARRLATALLAALRDETAALGARLVIAIAPDEAIGGHAADEFVQLTGPLQIPTFDLRSMFAWLEGGGRRAGWLLGHQRWDREGHFMAGRTVWSFLDANELLPDGVVSAAAIGGGQVAHLPASVAGIGNALWSARHDGPVAMLVGGALAVALLWVAAPWPILLADAWTAALGLALLWHLTDGGIALGCGLAAFGWWVVVEIIPGLLRRLVLLVAGGGLLFATLALAPGWVASDALSTRQLAAMATSVGFLRLISYAVDRGRGRCDRTAPLEFLAAMFFPPLLILGPCFSPATIAARRRTAVLPPGILPMAASVVGAAAATLVLVFAPDCVNVSSVDVFAGGGAALSRSRLWLWVFEPGLLVLATLWGWTTLGRALAALAGVYVEADVRAPGLATSVGDFWRRWWRSLAEWLSDYVFRPVGGRRRLWASAPLAFLLGATWYAWGSVKLLGVRLALINAGQGAVVWAVLNALLFVMSPRARAGVAGWWRIPIVLAVLAVASLPLVAPPMASLGDTAAVWGRLLGIE